MMNHWKSYENIKREKKGMIIINSAHNNVKPKF